MDDDYLKPRQQEAVNSIFRLLLDLPEGDRREVLGAIRYNDIFCFECGFGSEDRPNSNCCCWNDE